MHNRFLQEVLRRRARSRLGRLLVVTGARQTGKTTLVRRAFPDMTYLSMEDPVLRPSFTRLSAAEWIARYPRAIVDEVQKAPSLIETLKAAHDDSSEVRYVLTGSSQILLLAKVRESLAGRAALEELWPLTLPELASRSWDEPLSESRLIRWLRTPKAKGTLLGVPATSPAFGKYQALLERYLSFGGMPVAADETLGEEERESWLRDYVRTYLERDVADLAALRDLEPFVLVERLVAERTGRAVNFSDLARGAQVSPATARRFVRYLELSYQVGVLPPFHRNEEKRLAKMPKVHFLDPGVLRAVQGRRGPLSGEELESAVVSEILKQVRCAGLPLRAHHLRTHDGREVDLLLESDAGFFAIEVKRSRHVSNADARHLLGLEALLPKPVLGALLLSHDRDARPVAGGSALAVPFAWALGAPDG